jgi:hypothetical protein
LIAAAIWGHPAVLVSLNHSNKRLAVAKSKIVIASETTIIAEPISKTDDMDLAFAHAVMT